MPCQATALSGLPAAAGGRMRRPPAPEVGAVRLPPEPRIYIPAVVFCMSWCKT